MRPVVLSVAGSDPSGGAGVQADLKVACALGCYGTAVVTALTAQSTRGVVAVHPVAAGVVAEQLDTLLDDVPPAATKVGMLGTAAVAAVVGPRLAGGRCGTVVLDPVLRATSGATLLDGEGQAVLREAVLPHVDLLTPNADEAAALLGVAPARDVDTLAAQARRLLDQGPAAVLATGGHLPGAECVDALAGAAGVQLVRRARVRTTAGHGTGCTLSAALAALAARSPAASWAELVEPARDYLHRALAAGQALGVGAGRGPLDHLAGIVPDPVAQAGARVPGPAQAGATGR